MNADQFNEIAKRLCLLAATASTNAEANHWWAEAERFEDLTVLAITDPAAARAAYRPTRAYEAS
jgi:hypothetical protein